ncbi:hypothetical protein OC845_003930 [Tilletia horrida]|nr:hypothetical protein OC845_003930 [Tilletia horrida]
MRSKAEIESEDSHYSGSDWDEAIKKEHREQVELETARKQPKRRSRAAKASSNDRANSSKSASSSKTQNLERSSRKEPPKKRQRRQRPADESDEDLPPPPPIRPALHRNYGPKWRPLGDGRLQYKHDAYETVSEDENSNPLWDLLGMDRQGRLVEPLSDPSQDDSSGEDNVEPQSKLPVPMDGAAPSFPLIENAANSSSTAAVQTTLLIESPSSSSLSKNGRPQHMSLGERLKFLRDGNSAMKEDVVAIKDEHPGDASVDSPAQNTEDIKLNTLLTAQPQKQSLAQKLAFLRAEKEKAISLHPTQNTTMLRNYGAVSRSDPLLPSSTSSGSRSAVTLQSKTNSKRNASLPNWWGKETVEGLPEAQLNPRPSLPGAENISPSVGPLVLGCSGETPVQVNRYINRYLRDYQRDGIRFFYKCWADSRGGILGDDMGLGKTCQTISFLAAIMDKKGLGQLDQNRRKMAKEKGQPTPWPTALIICPNSVVENWCRELDMWGWFEYKTMDSRNMREVLTDFDHQRLDVVVATHDFITMHIGEVASQPFSCIIVDEVHRVKNPEALRTKAYNQFVCKIRFGLTGTAVQNDLVEFHTILAWSNPGRLGNGRQWDRTINMPLQMLISSDYSNENTIDEQIRREAFIRRLLPKFYLRRDKRIIADQMPKKRNNLVFCPLTDEQVTVYRALLRFHNSGNFEVAQNPCGCGRKHPKTGEPMETGQCCWPVSKQRRMLMWIYILKAASDHLALLFYDPADKNPHDPARYSKYLKQREICKVMYPDSWATKVCNTMNGLRTELCGKWPVLLRLLRDWSAAGDKVLLFSQNLRLLDWLEHLVEFNGFVHRRLDGNTPQQLRQSYVDDFNFDEKINVFLISTMAGGVGLNLTAANKVVIFDPHWNPAVDQQAQDRAYRIGQQRDVDVYRLIGSGSLEERIYKRQVHKQQIANLAYGMDEQERNFSGIKGVAGEEGELWGLDNLFTFEPRAIPSGGLIEEIDMEEVEAYAAELERAVKLTDVQRLAKEAERKAKAADRKGKRKEEHPAAESHTSLATLDPMEALILGDAALAQRQQMDPDGDSDVQEVPAPSTGKSGTSGRDDKLAIALAKRRRGKAQEERINPEGVKAGTSAKGRRALGAKTKLRRIDDVPTIYHKGDQIIIGRARPVVSRKKNSSSFGGIRDPSPGPGSIARTELTSLTDGKDEESVEGLKFSQSQSQDSSSQSLRWRADAPLMKGKAWRGRSRRPHF